MEKGENNMKNKFEEFYYEIDKQNYPISVYWNLYDKNHQEAIAKYDNHIFCPLCHTAPLSVSRGSERRYFRVIESNMDKHDIDCSYRAQKAGKRETNNFYKDLDNTDIRNRLVSCMNRMLKKITKSNKVEAQKTNGKNEYKRDFLSFTTDTNKKKYLPHKNFTIGNLEEDLDVQKIYYGQCSLYIVKFIPKGEKEIKKYYLKVLNKETKKQICDIAISPYIYEYLKKDFVDIPMDKNEALDYYLCFSGILEKGKITYSCKLLDSRLIVIEKEIEE